jgi:hypothetical protein
MIGDLTYQHCAVMLGECHRVLKPGGRIRLSTPDLRRLAGLYSSPSTATQNHYIRWSVDHNSKWADAYLSGLVINNMFQDYRFVYDGSTLGHVLHRCGFTDVQLLSPGTSRDPGLVGLEAHGRVIGDDRINAFETLTVEATKSSGVAARHDSHRVKSRHR